jgi:hypothetical protein
MRAATDIQPASGILHVVYLNVRFCRVECVRHKLRTRSLRRGWHHGGK